MTSMPPDDPLDGLTDEEMGWHLEHVGYVFVGTGEVARSKVMSSGSVTRMQGYVEGIYLFRRSAEAACSKRPS
jgi:hypothetical protein